MNDARKLAIYNTYINIPNKYQPRMIYPASGEMSYRFGDIEYRINTNNESELICNVYFIDTTNINQLIKHTNRVLYEPYTYYSTRIVFIPIWVGQTFDDVKLLLTLPTCIDNNRPQTYTANVYVQDDSSEHNFFRIKYFTPKKEITIITVKTQVDLNYILHLPLNNI